jgi:HEAT repeat protein
MRIALIAVAVAVAVTLISVTFGAAFVAAITTPPANDYESSSETADGYAPMAKADRSVRTDPATATARLIRDLGNHDWAVQIAAARALTKRQDRAIFNVLVKGLESKDTNRRLGSALAMALRKEPKALQTLLEQCPKRDISFRFQVAEVLGQAKNLAFKDTLIAALKDQNWQVREFAVVSLANMHEAIGIEPLFLALKNDDSYVRQLACWQLGCIGDTRAIGPLVEDILMKYDSYDYFIWGGLGIKMITEGETYFGRDMEKWEQWWKKNKNSYLVKP